MGAIIERAISWAVSIAQDDNYKYSQIDRWGTHSKSTPPYYYDCSSFVADAFTRASGKDFTQNYTTYTGNMLPYFTNNGFRDVTATGIIQRGDVLLTHNNDRQHTCIYTGTMQVNNTQGVAKQCVEALNTASGIVYNYNDFNHYEHILRYVEVEPTWHAKRTLGYDKESTEAIDNAYCIYNYLSGKGWTLYAICGLLGSLEVESGYNPWRWEGDAVLNTYDIPQMMSRTHGYGLVQFTPSWDYINGFSHLGSYAPNFNNRQGNPNDGHAQLEVVDGDLLHKWLVRDGTPAEYRQTYSEFKQSNNLRVAVGSWLYNYEYPSHPEQTIDRRYNTAVYWFEVLSGIPPTPPTPTTKRKLPIWLLKQTINKNTKGTFQL